MSNILDLTKELIRIPSVSSDITQLHNAIDFVANQFDGYGWIVKKLVFNEKPSLLVSNFEGKRADIVLNGHLDVVPVSDSSLFHPIEKEGKLYGRWAWDMKSGDAIMIELMKELLETKFQWKKVMLMLTSDEEVGGFDWVAKLTKLWYGGDVVIIPDGWATDSIVTSQKWVYIFNLTLYGQSCHSSRPWLWQSAIDDLIEVYQTIKTKLQDDNALSNEEYRTNTINLNMVGWGSGINIIPRLAKGTIDIRFTEKRKAETIVKIVEQSLEWRKYDLEAGIIWDVLYTNSLDGQLQRYHQITEEVLGESVSFEKEHGASDGRFFAEKSKVIIHRPTCANIHQDEEWVDIESLENIYEIYRDFVMW